MFGVLQELAGILGQTAGREAQHRTAVVVHTGMDTWLNPTVTVTDVISLINSSPPLRPESTQGHGAASGLTCTGTTKIIIAIFSPNCN